MSGGGSRRTSVSGSGAAGRADGGIRSADLSFVYGGFHVYGHRHGIVAEGRPGYGEGRQGQIPWHPGRQGHGYQLQRQPSTAQAGHRQRRDGFYPSNATVRIAGNTIFGAKSVEFIPPKTPSPKPLSPNAHVAASQVQLEVNTLFQSLIDLLHKIDPLETNATLSALSEGLRGHGDDLGALLSGLNTLTRQANPKLPALQEDFRKAAVVANVYADAAGDLNTVFDNLPTINKTIVDQKDNLNDTLLATIGLSNNAYETLAPAEQNFIDAINRPEPRSK